MGKTLDPKWIVAYELFCEAVKKIRDYTEIHHLLDPSCFDKQIRNVTKSIVAKDLERVIGETKILEHLFKDLEYLYSQLQWEHSVGRCENILQAILEFNTYMDDRSGMDMK